MTGAAVLTTTYLGMELRSPLISSAGPQSTSVDGVKALEEAGVGAVVLYSLFEEQLRHEAAHDIMLLDEIEDTSAESMSFFPNIIPSDEGVSSRYLAHLEACVKAADIPVIGSLNGSSLGTWTEYASQIESTGAAALELNVYLVPGTTDTAAEAVERAHLDILHAVKKAVSIPVAMKLSPFFSSLGSVATRLDEAGADGLVLFNRFVQPDIDVETVEVTPGIELSTPFESRLPRTWIAVLAGRVNASLAGTTGVYTGEDIAKYLLAGADVACATSSLLANGPEHAATMLAQLEVWMERKGFDDVVQVRGLLAGPDDMRTDAFQRAGYLAALETGKQRYGSIV